MAGGCALDAATHCPARRANQVGPRWKREEKKNEKKKKTEKGHGPIRSGDAARSVGRELATWTCREMKTHLRTTRAQYPARRDHGASPFPSRTYYRCRSRRSTDIHHPVPPSAREGEPAPSHHEQLTENMTDFFIIIFIFCPRQTSTCRKAFAILFLKDVSPMSFARGLHCELYSSCTGSTHKAPNRPI